MNIKPLTLTVLTDIHHYSKNLGISGKAYEIANAKSQIFLAQAGEVLSEAFEQIADDTRSDIVIISGDITSNGDFDSHNEIISMLRDLKSRGKRVYVITATHDFRNSGEAPSYEGDNRIAIPAATRDMLFDMYREFGPDEAISVHRESMSYIVQLCDGYRLFALNDDSNRNGKSGFSDECFEWITENAKKAREENQFIIAMTHHPLIAPSPIYEIIGKGDMLGDYKERIEQLADLGIQFIFTGHTHIPNVSLYQSKRGNVIYDICTGSTIGYPGSIRVATINPSGGKVTLSTDYVRTPESFKNNGKDLKSSMQEQLIGVVKNMIKTAGEDIDKLADMAQSISIKPKVIYKFGWIIKPIFKLLNTLKVGTVAKWTKKETGLKSSEWKEIKDKRVADIIIELVQNLFAGESKYPPETPTYKVVMGFLYIIDSIIEALHIDFKKLIKVVSKPSELVESLLYNPYFDAYNCELDINAYYPEGERGERITLPSKKHTVKKSKKGLAVIVISALILIAFLPIVLVLLLLGFIANQIKYADKLK